MAFTKLSADEFINKVESNFGTSAVTKDQLMAIRAEGYSIPGFAYNSLDGNKYDVRKGATMTVIPKNKSGKKVPRAPAMADIASIAPSANKFPDPVMLSASNDSLVGELLPPVTNNPIPNKTPGFIQWGIYSDIKAIIKSRRFFPLYVTGLSGNGKTLNIKQACAEIGRGFHRVNITIETSEDDLMGGFRLKNGDTEYEYGPVLKAMEAGDVLLLDEIDLGGPKLMALQSVLEGSGYYIKKLGRWVYPADGFTVIATGNTKGKGDINGTFMYANVMNEAMLERFKITLEQPYPDTATERAILTAMITTFTGDMVPTKDEVRAIDMLSEWATVIRESYEADVIDSVISTRRNVIIAETFTIYKDIEKAVKLGIARFDDETQEAMMQVYRTIDDRVAKRYNDAEAETARKANGMSKGEAKAEELDDEFTAMMNAANMAV